MQQYRFIGTESVVGTTTYSELGQRAAFSEEEARVVLSGGAKFLTEEDFNVIFAGEDIAAFPHANGYPEPPASLLAKRQDAIRLCNSYLDGGE